MNEKVRQALEAMSEAWRQFDKLARSPLVRESQRKWHCMDEEMTDAIHRIHAAHQALEDAQRIEALERKVAELETAVLINKELAEIYQEDSEKLQDVRQALNELNLARSSTAPGKLIRVAFGELLEEKKLLQSEMANAQTALEAERANRDQVHTGTLTLANEFLRLYQEVEKQKQEILWLLSEIDLKRAEIAALNAAQSAPIAAESTEPTAAEPTEEPKSEQTSLDPIIKACEKFDVKITERGAVQDLVVYIEETRQRECALQKDIEEKRAEIDRLRNENKLAKPPASWLPKKAPDKPA